MTLIMFTFTGLNKQTRTDNVQRSDQQLELVPYEDNRCKSPVSCLRDYLNATKHVCPDHVKQVFISSVHPYGPAKRGTFTNWCKKGLTVAGIDLNDCTHASTHASSSTAWRLGMPVE